MKELTDDQILQNLKQNTIGRNEQLSVLVNLLNSTRENIVLAIDGPWGSGKTVFIKQLLMLADDAVEGYGSNAVDEEAIGSFRKKQKAFYFNAWENDYIGDALGAVLLKLIAESDEGLNEAAIKRAFSMIDPASAIKKLSLDLVNPSAKTNQEILTEDIRQIVDRHDAVNDFLDKLKGDNERMIFVIDELDRCRPSFAVELLEVIKHYFVRDDITFIVATNASELSHTVQKYYGYNFDGRAYLNKFFDFVFSLATVDIEKYTLTALKWNQNGLVVYKVAHDAIKYFKFEMREINSYYSALRLVDSFLRRDRNWEEGQWSIQLIFVPLALALKAKNDKRFDTFVSGDGVDLLKAFLPFSDSALIYASKLVEERATLPKDKLQEQSIEALAGHYREMFTPEGRYKTENLQNFQDVVSLMSHFTTIASDEQDGAV